jgi:hypothetical protein
MDCKQAYEFAAASSLNPLVSLYSFTAVSKNRASRWKSELGSI